MSLSQIKEVHSTIAKMETNLNAATLVVQYLRGCIYIAAHQHFKTAELYKKWILENFEICTSTARRYICLANLIKTFPRLIVTGLSMHILTKHEKRIREAFKDDDDILVADTSVLDSRGNVICKITASSIESMVGKMKITVETPFGDSQTDKPSVDLQVFCI